MHCRKWRRLAWALRGGIGGVVLLMSSQIVDLGGGREKKLDYGCGITLLRISLATP
jgi:hypothetical protein